MSRLYKKYTIAGRCCESGDLIQENTMIQDVEVGDTLAVLSTGAYNYSMASDSNRIGKPAVVYAYERRTESCCKTRNIRRFGSKRYITNCLYIYFFTFMC